MSIDNLGIETQRRHQATLILRNKELARIKGYKMFRPMVREIKAEFARIEQEEKENQLKIEEISKALELGSAPS